MKRLFSLLLLLSVAFGLQAQISHDADGTKYWVQFTDKNNSPYSIDYPEVYLSERALQRRANQGIAIDMFDIPVNPQYLQAVAATGATLIHPSKWLNGVTILTESQEVLDAIRALDFVESLRYCPNNPKAPEWKEPDFERNYRALDEVASRGYYGRAYTQINQLNGIPLHDSGFRGEGMVIAVLDGGFEGADTHPAFNNMREEGRLLGTRSYVNPGQSVYQGSGHGTSCLSTMAGYVPQEYVGTAPKASYYLLHTENTRGENLIEEYNWVSAAEYADSLGVDVCSTSLGYVDFDDGTWNYTHDDLDGHTAPMSIGAGIACSRGMLCVNSAGNDGDSGVFPWIGIPADVEDVLTIGAVDGDGVRAGFSSIGPTADERIKPDVMAMGAGTYVAEPSGGYRSGNGTSYSCPVTAGMVACLWQSHPMATAAEIREAVRKASNRHDNPDIYYGHGIPDFYKALDLMPVIDYPTDTKELIDVYPNPAKGNVRVKMKEGVEADITVIDCWGRCLYAYHFNGLNHTTLENRLNELSAGVYFLTACSQRGNQTLKLVVLR
ncbi:MAG: S8 family serine peptidase [Candidatus Limimorpha sp.]